MNREQINKVKQWLSDKVFVNTYSRRYHSYYLKHVVERNFNYCYISEDSFITAVLEMGLPFRKIKGSKKSIRLPLSNKNVL
jgi:hypothetical protein